MDWRLKLIGQKLIGSLPGGMMIHERLQRSLGKVGRLSEESCREEIHRGLNMVLYAREVGNTSLRDLRILELGTGWHGSDALIFYLVGAKEVVTIDVISHLDPTLLTRMGEVAGTMLEEIAEASGTRVADVRERYDCWLEVQDLGDLESLPGISYRAPARVRTLDASAGRFDVLYSYSVLQRLRVADLRAELTAAHRLLNDSAIALHVVHHGDHNARHDARLNRLAYLKYSNWLYNTLQTDLLNFQNRLRSSEVIELFEESGYRVVDLKKTYAPPELLDGIQVAKRFQDISPLELRCTRSQVLLRLR